MIRIEIPENKLDHWGHETLIGANFIKLLKKAGIPVIGEFALRGIKSGMLWFHNEDGVRVFRYIADKADEADGTGFKRIAGFDGATVYMNGQHLRAYEDDEL